VNTRRRFARLCVLKKTDGLDDQQLRRALVPSGTSLLGLVQHLTAAETSGSATTSPAVSTAEPDGAPAPLFLSLRR
jgi:hypothetical protein